MAKTLFTYTGLDQIKLDRDDRSCYCSFKIFWKETGEQLAEIITNRSLEGRWIDTENGLKQVAGTCQYHLPGTLQGIRKALRALAAERIGLAIDELEYKFAQKFESFPELTDDDHKAMQHDAEFIAKNAQLKTIFEALS